MNKLNVSLDDVINEKKMTQRPSPTKPSRSRGGPSAKPKTANAAQSNLDKALDSIPASSNSSSWRGRRRGGAGRPQNSVAPVAVNNRLKGARPGGRQSEILSSRRSRGVLTRPSRQNAANADNFKAINRSAVRGGIQKQKVQDRPRVNMSVNRAQQGRSTRQSGPPIPPRSSRAYPAPSQSQSRANVQMKPAGHSSMISSPHSSSPFTLKDLALMKNIKIVAQLDKVPQPLQAQRHAKIPGPSANQEMHAPRERGPMRLNDRFGR